jgi:Sec7-like guanine-nucleotide exchange factor
MLNTDQHNSQVKKKMTLREFIKNQRKINNGLNFPEQFLSEVYTSIK